MIIQKNEKMDEPSFDTESQTRQMDPTSTGSIIVNTGSIIVNNTIYNAGHLDILKHDRLQVK
jgi:hypothetical protein